MHSPIAGQAQTNPERTRPEGQRFTERVDLAGLTTAAIEAAAEHSPAQVEFADALGQVSLGSASVDSGETHNLVPETLPNVEQAEALSALDLEVIMGISTYFVLGVRRRAQITREDTR